MKQQLQWSWTINTHGRPGKNISCDLHMEHLNRTCKDCSLGPNISDVSVALIGKCVLKLTKVTDQPIWHNDNVRSDSGRHSKRSAAKNLKQMLSVLKEQHVAEEIPERKHDHFHRFSLTLLELLTRSLSNNGWLNVYEASYQIMFSV